MTVLPPYRRNHCLIKELMRREIDMSRIILLAASGLFLFFSGPSLIAADEYFFLPVSDLDVTGGELPTVSEPQTRGDRGGRSFRANMDRFLQPYAVGDRGEEIYFAPATGTRVWNSRESYNANIARLRIAVRSASGERPSGKLYLPKPDFSGLLILEFLLPAGSGGSLDAKREFLDAKAKHYAAMLRRAAPGSAWFRHQMHETRREGADRAGPATRPTVRESELQRTYGLFSGGRAISENIQIDRELRVLDDSEELTVPVDSIEGITIEAIDWKEATGRQEVAKDPLAAAIPHDQHALFFPSFAALVELIDETRARGTPVLRLMEQRSEDARTMERYEKQLCLPLDDFARLFGPALISSVAMTGSDPYLRTGSDLAVLFETEKASLLKAAITARYTRVLAENRYAKTLSGTTPEGARFVGVTTAGRDVCSYLATLGSTVVVSNSFQQLQRVVATLKGQEESLANLDEYTFFRKRYQLGDRGESAFLIVSDATIRRWCGPRWRILASRRTRAAAAISELQARYFAELEKGNVDTGRLDAARSIPGLHDLCINKRGVYSQQYGTLEFLTPIAELPIEKVSEAEQRAYAAFRSNYQRRWRQFFDPIAARFVVAPDRIDLDVTVMPLIGASDYREFMEITGNAAIPPLAGDRHPESGIHFIMSIDKKSDPMRQAGGWAASMVPGLESGPLDWMGEWVALYADESPFWDDVAASRADGGRDGVERYLEENAWSIPVALHVDVANPLFMAGFLSALRAFVDQTAPGMLLWETQEQGDLRYVKVTPTEAARSSLDDEMMGMAIHYAALPDALIVSLDENVIRRALDRRSAGLHQDGETAPEAPQRVPDAGWLGRSVAVDARRSALDMVEAYFNDDITALLERRSWNNILILNEWRRRFGAADPVALHETFWRTRLVCPGNGTYVWNEQYQTMESTVFGFPGAPRRSASPPGPFHGITAAGFGMTFEQGGLRARVSLERDRDAGE